MFFSIVALEQQEINRVQYEMLSACGSLKKYNIFVKEGFVS